MFLKGPIRNNCLHISVLPLVGVGEDYPSLEGRRVKPQTGWQHIRYCLEMKYITSTFI